MSTSKKGKLGEKLAATYLEEQGYFVVEQNYRYKRGEIDLIVKKENLLVFVEVKLKSRDSYGFPEEAVNPRKEELIITTADQYLYEINWDGQIRFDIVSILGNGENFKISHFQDAFY